mmetsp:Transcript_24457/g.61342  ORF Transcript_24457/g.61342 Transcript_24457/m.61342 type:complete len:319 (+) Transcript_24457:634-1590(+)
MHFVAPVCVMLDPLTHCLLVDTIIAIPPDKRNVGELVDKHAGEKIGAFQSPHEIVAPFIACDLSCSLITRHSRPAAVTISFGELADGVNETGSSLGSRCGIVLDLLPRLSVHPEESVDHTAIVIGEGCSPTVARRKLERVHGERIVDGAELVCVETVTIQVFSFKIHAEKELNLIDDVPQRHEIAIRKIPHFRPPPPRVVVLILLVLLVPEINIYGVRVVCHIVSIAGTHMLGKILPLHPVGDLRLLLVFLGHLKGDDVSIFLALHDLFLPDRVHGQRHEAAVVFKLDELARTGRAWRACRHEGPCERRVCVCVCVCV